MAADGDIILGVENGIALITLNRPDSGNTLTQAMLTALGDAYRDCDQNDAVKVVVVTGSGDVFCAGADMSSGGSTFDGDSVGDEFSSCPLAFNAWDVRKPVIAACVEKDLVAMETRALHHSMAQPDAIEGVSAWLERRTPEWTASLNRDWPEDFE